MTGFGRGYAQADKAGVNIQVEINSVNRKTLDTQISAPREWSGFEATCNEWLKGAFQRGRVNIQVIIEYVDGSKNSLKFNNQAMQEGLEGLRSFASSQGIEFNPDASLLINLARSVKDNSELPDWKELKEPLKEAFGSALSEIEVMRRKEGTALAADLKKRINELNGYREEISKNASGSSFSLFDVIIINGRCFALIVSPVS